MRSEDRGRHPAQITAARRWLAVVLCVATVLLVACNDDPDLAEPGLAQATQPETGLPLAGEVQPGPEGEPVAGDFAGVPHPSGSQPFTPAAVEDGVTVQTFEVTATTPAQVIDFYRAELPPLGWEEGSGDSGSNPTEGTTFAQVTYTRDGQTLLITANDLDGLDSQYSLQLSGARGTG